MHEIFYMYILCSDMIRTCVRWVVACTCIGGFSQWKRACSCCSCTRRRRRRKSHPKPGWSSSASMEASIGNHCCKQLIVMPPNAFTVAPPQSSYPWKQTSLGTMTAVWPSSVYVHAMTQWPLDALGRWTMSTHLSALSKWSPLLLA